MKESTIDLYLEFQNDEKHTFVHEGRKIVQLGNIYINLTNEGTRIRRLTMEQGTFQDLMNDIQDGTMRTLWRDTSFELTEDEMKRITESAKS